MPRVKLPVEGGPFCGGEFEVEGEQLIVVQSCIDPPRFALYENKGNKWVYERTLVESDMTVLAEDDEELPPAVQEPEL